MSNENKTKNLFLFGEWYEENELSSESVINEEIVHQICMKASYHQKHFSLMDMDHLLKIINGVQKLWQTPKSPYYQKALSELPALTGHSRKMIELALSFLPELLDSQKILQKWTVESRGFSRFSQNTKLTPLNNNRHRHFEWHPLGSILHILSGNVFLVGVNSLLMGAITGNISLIKMSQAERLFMPLFVQSIIDAENELKLPDTAKYRLSKSIALFYYPSHSNRVVDAFKRNVNGIVVWGSEQAIQSYARDLPANTKLIPFGPKLSFCYLTIDHLRPHQLKMAATYLANELAIWDQGACTAPQVCYLEGDSKNKHLFYEELKNALDLLGETLPAGVLSDDQAAEMRNVYNIFTIVETKNLGKASIGTQLQWLVTLDERDDKSLVTSPLHRSIRLIPVESKIDLDATLRDMKGYIQTVGLIAKNKVDYLQKSKFFASSGALRVVPLGKMGHGHTDDPHDGGYDLVKLMNLISIQLPESQENSFWHAENIEDESDTLGGYVTRTGGSSRESQFVRFSKNEWEAMTNRSVQILQEMGVSSKDRIGNCMMGGNLYGSFISFNDVNYKLGALNFTFSGQTSAKDFYSIWKKYQLNVLQGVPSSLMKLLRSVHAQHAINDDDFHIEKIIYSGEPLAAEDRSWLKNNFKTKSILSVIGTTEVGPIAYQDESLEGTPQYNLLQDFNLIEVGQDNELYVSALYKIDFPVQKFPIGDCGEITEVETEKSRGKRRKLLTYLGRTQAIISIAGLNLSTNSLITTLAKMSVTKFQCEVSFVGEKTLLDIAILENKNLPLTQKRESSLKTSLFDEIPDLEKSIKNGLLSLSFKAVKNDQFKLHPKSGKHLNLIDHRQIK